MDLDIIGLKFEPGVINNKMLNTSILQQGHEKTQLLEHGNEIQMDAVSQLRLDFLNILKIDHLWMLKSLSKLTLTHNKIEVIENLDQLVHLKELDLSFNEISTIENLEKLVNVEVLMLNNNRIKRLENIDTLQNLIVFSISGNLIQEYKDFVYLRRFKTLKSLSLKDNPCCENEHCDSFVKAILPTVSYINYARVTTEEKLLCTSQFSFLIKKLEDEEELLQNEIINRKKIDEENEFNALSFVEYLNDSELFDTMFEQDKNISEIVYTNDTLRQEYDDYRSFYGEIMREFVEFGHKEYHNREKEIKQYDSVIEQARNSCAEKNKQANQEYYIKKIEIFNSILSTMESTDSELERLKHVGELCKILSEAIENLWNKLMTEEITLYEQSEETRSHFARNIEELSHQMIAMGKIVFNKWREREMEWTVDCESILHKILENNADVESDQNCLQLENEHMQFINDREELLIARVQKWSNELISRINWEEIRRNRKRILEIIYLIEKYKSNLEKLQKRFDLFYNEGDFNVNTFLKSIDM
ncbi:dynein regulatory complex subunit TbCMF46 [Arctopsyche grandis]|uniref:dynein regulatory complex subunit TbCMF46 n=1 Tax=Arctopsyche grandis TaxID=121162 RepID=UPI00406D6557